MRRLITTLLLLAVIAVSGCAHSQRTAVSPVRSAPCNILKELSAARKTVWVAAYGIHFPAIVRELVKLHKSGVSVVVYLDRRSAMSKSTPIYILLNGDIRVLVKKKNALNNRYMIIDGKEVIAGSYDFSPGARRRDDSPEVIRNSPELVRLFSDDFQKMLAAAEL